MNDNAKLALESVQDFLRDLEGIDNIVLNSTEEKMSSKLALEQIITDKQLYIRVEKLFADGHHTEAVSQACKFLDNLVSKKSSIDLSGEKLMKRVFSVNKPILQLNDMLNQSEKDEQRGHMDLFAGLFTGIRNPRAHQHDWEDTELRTIQILSFINYLVSHVRSATKNLDKI